MPATAAQIEQVLPQTQCRQCGYDGCAGYARAIAAGLARINRCPAGGARGIERLAQLTGASIEPLDPECGREMPFAHARIDPMRCIGCRVCTSACPVDAIVGIPGRMHAVLADWCTGCGLCVAPCPLDAIQMVDEPGRLWNEADAMTARSRYLARCARLNPGEDVRKTSAEDRRRFVAGIVARVRARRAASKP